MANTIISYLQSMTSEFSCLDSKDVMSLQQSSYQTQSHWIRAVLLKARDGIAMAVLPSGYLLDFSLLSNMTHKEMEPVLGVEADRIMKGFEAGIRVPIPQFFKLPGLIDSSVREMDKVWFEAGDGQTVIEMTGEKFMDVCKSAFTGRFSLSKEHLNSSAEGAITVRQFTPMRIQNRIEDIIELPSMPSIAMEILKLRNNRHATSKTLAQIIEKDPSLAAQIVGWASAAYYGFRGTIDSVETAINNVLGYQMVINMCLGVVLGKTLKVPQDGPLGLKNYWRQAVLCATLAERICLKIPVEHRPIKGLVYLSGLLHNIGHLLLAHAFPPHSFVISRFIESNPHICVNTIEKHVLGVSHSQIGAWLLTSWGLPEEIVEATRWHHQEEYASPNAAYSNMILLANQVIGKLMLGDARPTPIPVAVLDTLGLTEDNIESAWSGMSEHIEELEALADKLAA